MDGGANIIAKMLFFLLGIISPFYSGQSKFMHTLLDLFGRRLKLTAGIVGICAL